MSHIYRCCKCKARHSVAKPIVSWTKPRYRVMTEKEIDAETKRVGGRRCKKCGHTGFYPDKVRIARLSCRCNGGLIGRTGSIPHRPGSAGCELRWDSAIQRAIRAGATPEEVADLRLEMALNGNLPVHSGPCPF